MKRSLLTTLLCLSIASAAAWAQENPIHLAAGKGVPFLWQLQDGAGYKWVIQSTGTLCGSTSNAYNSAMKLRLDGQDYEWSGQANASSDGREIEIGPWNYKSLKVYRRIYVDPKLGYCRWIDIFENSASSDAKPLVEYYSNLGPNVGQIFTATGKTVLSDDDWGVMTADAGNTQYPATMHFFASREARNKPHFGYTIGSNNVYCTYTLTVPAGKTAALCLFEMQRSPVAAAKELMEKFDTQAELAKIAPALRTCIANFDMGSLFLESLNLSRSPQFDMITEEGKPAHNGTIKNESFTVESRLGKLELPASAVIGMISTGSYSSNMRVALVDGQVISGAVTGPFRIAAADGTEASIEPDKVSVLSYKISPAKGEKPVWSKPLVELRGGDRFLFNASDVDFGFRTLFGQIALPVSCLQDIYMDTPAGGLHRACMVSGTTISGLMTATELNLQTDWGKKLSVSISAVQRFRFPTSPKKENLAKLRLRNDDLLVGQVVPRDMVVWVRGDKTTVKSADITSAEFTSRPVGTATLQVQGVGAVSGRVEGDTFPFKIDGGVEIPVSIAYVDKLEAPPPAPPAATAPAAGTASATTKPGESTTAPAPTTRPAAATTRPARNRIRPPAPAETDPG